MPYTMKGTLNIYPFFKFIYQNTQTGRIIYTKLLFC